MRRARFLAVLLVVTAGPSFAQSPRFQLTLFGGVNHVFAYGSVDDYVAGSNDFPVTPAHTPIEFGAAFAYRFSDRMGIELRGQSTLSSNMTLADPSDQDTVTIKSSKHTAFSLNFFWEIGAGKLKPYLAAGAGLDKLSSSAGDYVTKHGYEASFAAPDRTLDFFVNAGAGLRFVLTVSWGVSVDVRYRFLSAEPNKVMNLAASGGVWLMF